MVTKKHLSISLFCLTLSIVFAVKFYSHAYASDPVHIASTICKPDQNIFEKISEAFKNLDIRKTVQNMILTAITDGPIQIISGRNPTEMMECSIIALRDSGIPQLQEQASSLISSGGACSGLNLRSDCSDFTEAYDYQTHTNPRNMMSYISSRSAGSLLGIVNTISGAVKTEPVPVSLALYWNESVKNIPFAGTALAAVEYRGLPSPLTMPIFVIWKVFRNLAFGMLSIVMLTTGIMIMMRKKLPPNLTVTAQYAIPKIVLAVILITFSYAIGAVLASSAHEITQMLQELIYQAFGFSRIAVATIIIALLFISFVMSGLSLGVTGLVVLAIITLILLLVMAAATLKAWLTLVKLLFSIVFSPVQFALGAIPGNEGLTSKWFKRVFAYVAGYVGIFVMITIVEVTYIIIFTTTSIYGTRYLIMIPNAAAAPTILTILIMPFFLIFGYIQAIKVPSRIEAFLLGEKSRR